MSAIDELAALIETTDIMKQVHKSLREEPAYLLKSICREYQKSERPVPDHHLSLTGYLGEASLKALLAAALIKRQPGGTSSLYTYEPTAEGLRLYHDLEAESFFKKSPAPGS